MNHQRSFLAVSLALALASAPTLARDAIHIVGSSTVYPFATVVAERFGRLTRYATPVLESTGSGGGLKLFCQGVGLDTPSITNASRRIKQSEIDLCEKNGVGDIMEIKIGYDGIVVGSAKTAPKLDLSRKALYLALAGSVPDPDGAQRFVPNPYTHWSEVDAGLPKQAIQVMGPPPTSGTRDAFVELALEGGCKKFAWVAALKKRDKNEYKARCRGVRQDGGYIEAGENDNLIVRKLSASTGRLGVFGYSFLVNNVDTIQGAQVDGVEPTFENIASGDYPVSRSLYFYVKKAHIASVPGIIRYLREFASKRAIGPEGYLPRRGLIPLGNDERRAVAEVARKLTAFEGL